MRPFTEINVASFNSISSRARKFELLWKKGSTIYYWNDFRNPGLTVKFLLGIYLLDTEFSLITLYVNANNQSDAYQVHTFSKHEEIKLVDTKYLAMEPELSDRID